MSTLLVTHFACLDHDPGAFHPEHPNRLRAIYRILEMEAFSLLKRAEAPHVTREQLLRVHPLSYIEAILDAVPHEGCRFLNPEDHAAALDEETYLSPGSGEAALRSAGGVILAVDAVMAPGREARNAFVPVRPPGHHAERDKAMGFCLFNNVAIGALHARRYWKAGRVAVVDFDVHHGNGIQHVFWDDPTLFYASTHEDGLFPFTGRVEERGCADNIVNHPLSAGADGEAFRAAFHETILPRLRAFAPDLIFISAGFDAHVMDPMSSLNLKVEDFTWVTHQLLQVADEVCDGRVISVLEGGYDLTGLTSCVLAHVKTLMDV